MCIEYLNANAEINKLYHWFFANRLVLNATKTKYIIIKPNQRKCNVVNMSFEIGGTQLMGIGNDCTESATKFLGLNIDDSLNWKSHVSAINSKIARAIFAIKQVKHFLPYDSLRTIYYALI